MTGGPYREAELRLALTTPRPIPRSLWLAIVMGGWPALVGWIVFGTGAVIGGIFIPMSDLPSLYRYDGELTRVPGAITAASATGINENRRMVWKLHFTFQTPNGQTRKGRSYSRTIAPVVGQRVEVEYPAGRPDQARITGARTRPLHAAAALAGLPMLIAVPFLIYGVFRGRRILHLLRHGKPAFGKLLHRQPTSVRVNKRMVYKLTFEFEADGQKYQTTARTHRTETLSDERGEPLLYHPLDPTRATLLDHLPGAPELDGGQFRRAASGSLVLALLPPALAIAGGAIAFAITTLKL